MASCLSLLLAAVAGIAFFINVSSARVIPAEPLSVMLDANGSPILILREKRTPLNSRSSIIPGPSVPIHHRAMMFTGYYRPSRRSYTGDQAAGAVFAQGNAVSGGSYLGVPKAGIKSAAASSTRLKNGPEPIDELELSSARAEAAPELPEDADTYKSYDDDHQHEQPGQTFAANPAVEEHDETSISGLNPDQPLPYDIESGSAVENDGNKGVEDASTAVPEKNNSPSRPAKKGKKTPIIVEEEEELDEDDDEEFDDEESYGVPVLPAKGNKRRNGYVPNLNNFFPMSFRFPSGFSRRGGSGSSNSGSLPAGVITAIANSYSTGKGGVASSVATAYGGSPPGKKARRAPTAAAASSE